MNLIEESVHTANRGGLKRLFLPILIAPICLGVFHRPSHGQSLQNTAKLKVSPVVGDTGKLERRFQRWASSVSHSEAVFFPLSWSKARSSRRVTGIGSARIDRAAAQLEVKVNGLAQYDQVDLWMVPFHGGQRAARLLSRIELSAGAGSVLLDTDKLAQVELERLVIVERDGELGHDSLLHGTPGLFDRLKAQQGEEVGGLPFGLGEGDSIDALKLGLEQLVGQGERLFFEQTFEGNGRTCGTCHPAQNDFTLDAAFISTLPASDPLFVAERLPALDSNQNGGLVFENPVLMRAFGLIVVNIDGFSDPADLFVMRGVQHLLGLGRTIVPAPNLDQPLTHLLGWSGDGSSGSGSLREFADGAVMQHYPRTMGRVAGRDFRLPTPTELNALEAFMLSLGRDEDMDLGMPLTDAGARRGRQLFTGIPSCNNCHLNGGSNSNFFSIGIGDFLQNTGVELATQASADGTGERRPVDGGFGTNPEGDFSSMVPNEDLSFGERTFNSQSIIEAASTVPSFHSNLTANPRSGLEPTIEGAIRFYTTPEFTAGAGFPIFLSDPEIADLGRFLRVLSALDDLDTIEGYAQRAALGFAARSEDRGDITRLLELAAIECGDASSVLSEVGLHPGAVQQLSIAALAFSTVAGGRPGLRLERIAIGLAAVELARQDISN